MKQSSKEYRETTVRHNVAFQTDMDAALKAPPVMTWSARMPAYTYTCLCPVVELREPPGKGILTAGR